MASGAFLSFIMPATFTYTEGDLSTALNWARFRLDDTDPQIRANYQGEPAPFLWDEDYLYLFDRFGVQEGAAQAAERINLILSKRFVRFTNGPTTIQFKRDSYETMAQILRTEPAYDPAETVGLITVGQLKAGVTTPDGTARWREVVTGGVLYDTSNYPEARRRR